MDEIKEKLSYICSQFRIEGEILVYRWIPSGHINTAYYAAVYDGKEIYQLLIQRINTYVFRDPVGMMRNIERITEHKIGRINVWLSIADSSSLRHRIAPVPRGIDPLSSTLKADASSAPGLVLFLISIGCSFPSASITRSISLVSLSR